MSDELTSWDCDIILGAIERQIEYGHPIELMRDLIVVYDKVKKIREETTVNQ